MELKSKSTEELQELLSNKVSEKEVTTTSIPSRLVTFIQDNGITEGNHYCANYLLYDIYCKEWYPKGEKVSQTKFSRELKKFLPYKRKTKSRGFLINKVYHEERRIKAKENSLESQKQREAPKPQQELHTTE